MVSGARRSATIPGKRAGQEDPAIETRRDILGRPVEIESPDGTTLLTYGMLGRAAPGGSQPTLLESVLTKNAKGDFTRHLLDGDRVVWVDECTDADPTCPNADRTFYTYEPSGELQAVYDAKVGAGNAPMSDAAHKLAYRYDTLGRSWKIEDPDGGMSTTVTDAVGRVESTTNARNQITSFEYDDLDRLTAIDQPVSPQRDYQITYRSTELQPERERILAQNGSEAYSVTSTYNELGRVFRKAFKTQSPLMTLLLDFGYDELGRTTSIRYPDNATVVRYEYDGAYLNRVCEVTSPEFDCNDPNAVFYVGSSTEDGVAYDHLGRRTMLTTPAGTQDFAYDPNTQRLATDEFNSKTGGLYHRTLEYADYDPLGNIVQIDGDSSTDQVDLSATYTYDRRNRLASWEKPGLEVGGTLLVPATPEAFFNYDALGNLTGHAVGTATAANQTFGQTTRPHGITQRTDLGIAYTYDLDGNLASETWSTGARHYTFDALNRLVCVGPAASGCGTLQVDYDSHGSRIFEMYLNSQGSGWTSPRHYAGEYFTLDAGRADFHIFAFGEQIAYKRKIPFNVRTAETWVLPWFTLEPPPPLAMVLFAALGLACLGLLAVRHEWAPGLRENPGLAAFSLALVVVLVVPPLPARAGGGGTNVLYRRWILGDHLGSATVILKANPLVPTEPQGEVEREVVYAPFGGIHQDEGSQGMDTETFAGHPRDPTTGLHYMRARWQNPTTGSFLSVDPMVGNIARPQSLNAYSYAEGDPLNLTDPTGLCAAGAGFIDCLWREGRYGQLQEYGLLPDPSSSESTGFSTGSSGLSLDVSAFFSGPTAGPSLSLGGAGGTSQGDVQLAAGPAAPLVWWAVNVGFPALVTWWVTVGAPTAIKNDQTLPRKPQVTQQSGAPDRSIDDPSSLEGATPEEVEEAARAAGLTTKQPFKDSKGGAEQGVRLSDPAQPGRTVRINKGYPGSPGVHGGPYATITGKGPNVPVPLAGNPTLR